MSDSTLARSLPRSATRRWRALRLRTRVVLALMAVVSSVVGWSLIRARPEVWPTRAVLQLPPRNRPLMLSPDGRTFLSTGEGGLVPWDLGTGRQGTPWATREGLFLTRGAYSPDGRTFAAAILHHPQLATFELIDPDTGRARATLTTRHPIVYHMAFADEGRTFRAFLGDSLALKEAVTWDVATGQQTSSRPINATTRGCSTAFSPDGRLLAWIPWPSTAVQLLDLETSAPLGGLSNPPGSGFHDVGVEFSPDGRTLAVARSDGAIDFWDVDARKILKTLPVHPRRYSPVAIRFSPDGRTLSSFGVEVATPSALARAYDGLHRKLFGKRTGGSELIILDIGTGRRIGRVSSSHYPIFTPDGRALVTFGEDLTLRLRDLPEVPK
jgi:WD40 repeat protein